MFLIYPNNYKESTQNVLFFEIAKKLKLVPISYEEFYSENSFNFKDKIKIVWNFIRLSIKSVFLFHRLSLRIDGIVLSHSLIESYLRYNESYNFRKDIRFFKLLYKSIKYLFKAEKNYKKIGLLIGGDEAYILGSILGQICQKKAIPNIFFKDHGFLCGFKFDNESLFASVKRENSKVKRIDPKSFEFSKNALHKIVTNEINYFYMKDRRISSPLSLGLNKEKDYFILYLHDFIDSPGIFGDTVFFDIPSWVKFCAKAITELDEFLIIKSHPNAVEINKKHLKTLEKELEIFSSNVKIVDQDFNLSEFNKTYKLKAVISIFGTVVYEAAYLGIQSIVCGNAPANTFENLSFISKTKKELLESLRNIQPLSEKEQEYLKIKAIKSKALFDSNLNSHKIADLPYEIINEEIAQKVFNSKYDSDFDRMNPITWRNSIRLKKHVEISLNEKLDWLDAIKKISGFQNKLSNNN